MKYFRELNVWLSLCLPRSVTLIGETEIAKSVYTFPYVFFPATLSAVHMGQAE
jgi:hypothetical protein